MKLDSKYFDSIRVTKGRKGGAAQPAAAPVKCQWHGCDKRGAYKAPKGRESEGQYYNFCREHVADYNKDYNYFSGMKEGEFADFQKAASTGHRPTWSMGVNGAAHATKDDVLNGGAAEDPLEILRSIRAKARGTTHTAREAKQRFVQKGAKKHLEALNLDETASAEDIRTQFKALVKLHHPDSNGGDRGSEERFREVIAAYNFLKQSGLC
jgi:hypothetical protein